MVYQKVVFSLKSLWDDKKSYEEIDKLTQFLCNFDNKPDEILVDFSEVEFLSGNLLSPLGCILQEIISNRIRIQMIGLKEKIILVMQKNGFSRHLSLDRIADRYNTSLPYIRFSADSNGIELFEKYVIINLFQRNNIPDIPKDNVQEIIDNLLEIFNNVIDHACAEYVYICGQFFPKKGDLCLSISDIGNTIEENVQNHFRKFNCEFSENPLEWALAEGNSTKEETPGGLGLSMMKKYLFDANGSMTVISGKNYYNLNRRKEEFDIMNAPFRGTLVTITFNMNFYKERSCEEVQIIMF